MNKYTENIYAVYAQYALYKMCHFWDSKSKISTFSCKWLVPCIICKGAESLSSEKFIKGEFYGQ